MICELRDKVGQVLVPGDEFCCGPEDTIPLTPHAQPHRVVCGPGLRRSANRVQVCKSGVLRHKEPNMFWMESQQKRVSRTGTHQCGVGVKRELSASLCSVCPH